VPVDIKFCGLTRPDDAACAVSLGAAYTGVIFAPSPRRLDPMVARTVLDAARGAARTAGVFGAESSRRIAEVAIEVGLDVVQLHGDPSPATVRDVRRVFAGEVWAVVRITGSELPANLSLLMDVADALVLDAKVPGQLGGTGVTFDWNRVAKALDRRPGRARLVLAGGLKPENVAHAIRVVAPDIVDVSSGVESAPGIKDHARMRAFSDAVRRRGEAE
jgi:phosphoribosylanthranilate isomerase